jgi:hypothetical protein
MTPIEVRAQLTDALRLDLGRPGEVLGAKGEEPGNTHEADRKSFCVYAWASPLIRFPGLSPGPKPTFN